VLARKHGRCGFTLVELLVVIAIVALLIGVLLPSLARARDAGRVVQCLSNMRQLAQYTAAYANDSGGLMPRSQHSSFPNRVAPWGYAFYSFITGSSYTQPDASWLVVLNGPYRCPFDTRRVRWSYGFNVYFELTRQETGGRTWTRQDQAPNPSKTVLFGELMDSASADHAMAHFWSQFAAPPEVSPDRHKNGSGHVYLDGHAGSHPFSESFDPTHAIDRWNPSTAR